MRGHCAVRGEIHDVLEIDLDPPDRARKAPRGRDAGLGGVAVPLRPDGRLRVAEVDRADDVAALPAAVRRLLGPEERLRANAGDPEPGALDVDPLRRRLLPDPAAQENDSFSSSATIFETSR